MTRKKAIFALLFLAILLLMLLCARSPFCMDERAAICSPGEETGVEFTPSPSPTPWWPLLTPTPVEVVQ